MTTRQEFLGDVAKALKKNVKNNASPQRKPLPPPLENVMPTIPAEQLAGRFEEELKSLGCDAYRASNLSSMEGILRSILERSKAKMVALSRNPLLSQLQLAARLEQWGKSVSVWPQG